MHAKVDMHIAQLGIELPTPAPPAGAYVPFVVAGRLLLVAGQLPMWNGTLKYDGRVGAEITLEDGIAAARLCGLNLLAQARAACDGDLDRVRRVLRLGGFVQAAPGFHRSPQGAERRFGADGRGVRSGRAARPRRRRRGLAADGGRRRNRGDVRHRLTRDCIQRQRGWSVQRRHKQSLQLAGEFLMRIRLEKPGRVFMHAPLMQDCLPRVSGGEEDFQLRI